MQTIAASEARANFAQVLERVHYHRERIAIERRGKPFAALVPIEDLELIDGPRAEVLRQSEARLRAIMDHAPMEIYLKDAEGRYVEVNRHYERLLGIRNDEIAGKLPGEAYPDLPAAAAWRERDLAVLENGRVIEDEESIHPRDRRRVMHTTSFPILDADGAITGLGAIAFDLTERKTAEEALRQALALRQETERMARLGFWQWDELADRCEFCSEELAKLHGVTVEEYLRRTDSADADLEWVHPDDRDRIAGISLDAREKGSGFECEYRLLRADGEVLEVFEAAVPIADESGRLLRTVGFIQDITERKQVEKALKKSERRFHDFAEASSDWFWEMDADCRFSYFSDRFTEITGVPQDALLGRTREETMIPGVDPAQWRRHLSDLAAQRSFRDFQHPRRHPDGRLVHLSINGKAVFGEAGDFKGYRGTGSDVTVQTETEDVIRRSEERFRGVFDLGLVGVAFLSPDGQFQEVNEAYRAFLGYDADELIGEHFEQVIHPEDYPAVKRRLDELLSGKVGGYQHERRYRHKDGRELWGLASLAPLRNPDGSSRGFIVQVLDITERRMSEEALRQSEARFRAFLDSSPDPVSLKGPDGRYLLGNRQFELWSGCAGEQLRGKTHEEVFSESANLWPLDIDHERRVMDSKAVITEEREAPDGTSRWFSVTKFPVLDDRGRLTGIGTTYVDITDRKRAEQALRDNETSLKQAAQMARMGHWVWDDVADRMVSCSEEIAAMRGLTVAEVVAGFSTHENLLRRIHPDDRARYQAVIARADALKQAYDLEYREISKEGEIQYFRERGEPVLDADGNLSTTIGMTQDITSLKRTEEELRRARDELEFRVEERTAELRTANEALTREIGERKQAEAEAERSRALLATAVEALDEGFVIFDDQNRMELCNSKYREFFSSVTDILVPGVSLEELLRTAAEREQTADEEGDPEAWVRERLARFRAAEGSWEEQTRDGRWVLVTERRTKEGGIVGIRTDITERKRSEEALARSEDRMRQATQLAGLGYYIWDSVADRCLYCSEEVARIHGTTVEDYMARGSAVDGPWSFTHPDDRDAYVAGIEKLRKGDGFKIEYRVVTPDGEIRHVAEIIKPVFDETGRVIQEYGTIQDITERKRAEDARRESEARYREIFDESPIAIWTEDWSPIKRWLDDLAREGVTDWRRYFDSHKDSLRTIYGLAEITEISRAAVDLYRTENLEELLEISSSATVIDEELDAFRDIIIDFLAGRATVDIESKDRAGDGSEIIARRRVVIPSKYRSDWSRVIYAIEDITDHARAEEQLRQAQKMEAVGQLTGGVAHDFNNLLAVIMGNAEFLFDELGGGDGGSVESILKAASRGAELTQRLLAFSRQQPLHPRAIDLGDLVAGMTGLIGRTLGETIAVETRFAADAWSARADPGQVENALLNLAINARDSMPEGGRLRIEVANTKLGKDCESEPMEVKPGDYVMLSVSDTGEGMDLAVLERAFEPFFTTKDVGEGSGLGLSMVYGFAKQSGGDVRIDSASGFGTTVKLYLPRAESGGGSEHLVDELAPVGRGETVLVVEDDEDVRKLAERLLNDLGYHVLTATDAQTGLGVLDAVPDVDLLLSDVVLPGGMSGLGFAATAARRKPALKQIFMSGYTGAAADLQDPLPEGALLLGKPFRKRELALMLRAALEG